MTTSIKLDHDFEVTIQGHVLCLYNFMGRADIDLDGRVVGIHQTVTGPSGRNDLAEVDPQISPDLYEALRVVIETDCADRIADAIEDWHRDRPNRIADRRRAEGVYMAGI